MIYLLAFIFYLLIGMRVLGYLIVRDGWDWWGDADWDTGPSVIILWPIGIGVLTWLAWKEIRNETR